MPRYTVTQNWIECIGPLWVEGMAAKNIDLSDYDLNNMRDDNGQITRDSIEQWLCLNEHDFQYVTDFSAYITDGNNEIAIPWAHEESTFTYSDCMYPQEDDN